MGSWVEAGGGRCFQLMEYNDERLFQQWILQWHDLTEFEILLPWLEERIRPKRRCFDGDCAQASQTVNVPTPPPCPSCRSNSWTAER